MSQHDNWPVLGGTESDEAIADRQAEVRASGLTLEQRMYPNLAPAAGGPMSAQPGSAQDLAETMYPGDGQPPSDGNYAPAVGSTFDLIERQLADAGRSDDVKILRGAKVQVVATMRDLGVGMQGARELSRIFGNYSQQPATEEGLEALGRECQRQLQNAWGKAFAANMGFAAIARDEVARRIPWFLEELNNGAGNDPAVIRHMAAIGKRIAKQKGKPHAASR